MKRLFALIIFLLLSLQPSMAYNGGYSPGYEPYTGKDGVRLFPLLPFEQQKPEQKEYDTMTCKGGFEIKVDRTPSPALLQIRLQEKEIFSEALPECIYSPYVSEAWRGDLNGDGMSDFICVFGGTGCGLASEYCHVVFVLSYQGRYYLRTLFTMGFGREHVVDWFGDGRCTIIHTWFVYGEPGKDGQSHNYWVHNFLEISSGSLEISERIPWKWIMYTYKPNHNDTVQLTEQQKVRCWMRSTLNLFMR